MKITNDLTGPILTPSFNAPSISKGNKPGNFSLIKWLILGLIFAFLLLSYFSKNNEMKFFLGRWYTPEEHAKLLRLDDVYKYNPRCSIKKEDILNEVQRINTSTSTANFSESNINGSPSEGTNIKAYKFEDDRDLMQVARFATLARSFTNYYVKDNDIFYVEVITDEWDLKKLYGENGELSPSEGQYVIATSTKESYLLQDRLLCQILTEQPRQESVAVTASDPDKDLDYIFRFYDTYLK